MVVLHTGHLTAEEANEEFVELKKKEEKELIETGKIVFKPQKKRSAPSEPASSSTKDGTTTESKRNKKEDSDSKSKLKKPSLLSFDEDQD